jgi:hypothetical protein
MATSIAWWIGLSFDNTTADPVSPSEAHNRFSDEISGQLNRVTWQIGP